MDFKTFLENFDAIAEAPGGIPKLRSLILDLAVRGKLVPQNPDDEPAYLLLRKVLEERHNLIEQKQLKKESELPPVSEEEILHSIPENWVWTRLGQVVHYTYAKKIDSLEILEDEWLLDLEDIEKDTSKIIRKKTFKEQPSKSTKAYFKRNDVLYGKLRPYLNKVLVADDDGYCTTEIVPMKPCFGIVPKYVMYVLKRSDFLNYVNSKTYGINLPRLGTEDARKALFPLPSTKEQKRIVEKVDELMGLCDRYEAAKQTRDKLRQKLRESAIASLMNAETDEELDAAWVLVRNNWHNLSQQFEDVGSLRKSVLELAIRGKLVPQNPQDEPASILLEKIRFEKEQLVRSKPIKVDKALPKIERDTLQFETRFGWEWCYITDISQRVTDGEHATPQRSSSGYYLLSARNVRDEGIILDDVDYVPEDEFLRIRKRCDPDKGDILISCSGSVGRVAVVDKDKSYVMVRSVALIKPFQSYIFSKFLAYALRAASVQSQIIEKSRASAQANLFLGKIKEIKIPLPPLAEQKRIVAKVDELMKLCDQLEVSLRQSQQRAESLAASAISHLTI